MVALCGYDQWWIILRNDGFYYSLLGSKRHEDFRDRLILGVLSVVTELFADVVNFLRSQYTRIANTASPEQ